ncbi:serine hydrolase [Cryobacterium sp.]|uniref:serine hydrolase domain-containing protein n=1 Tax=Cryobacterium sp. TaxID=1926290 RepID=UPI0026217B7B|nr:serine hydrolase domain-containing protein [Cryobacterium sp.]MCU1447206.1 beta-lactamase [Cryobacterium sp.]
MTAGTDATLAAGLRMRVGRRHRVIAAATVTSGEVTTATLGADPDADFEIGSISKGFTGLLYVDALERGEIDARSTLGDYLPLGSSAAAALALREVSTHSSGLPRLPPGIVSPRTMGQMWLHGANPYGEDLPELLEQVTQVKLGRPRPAYSNLGFELLGHAIAAAAGTTYRELVAARLTGPLDLPSVYAPSSADELRSGSLLGTSRLGRPQQAWTGEALAPAGGIRASIQDMGRFTLALLDGSAPGIAALDPVAPLAGPAVRIGAAWITLDRHGRHIVWHNGGTGGFRSWIGIDRAAGTGVVVISATARSVDRLGMSMLTALTEAAG